MNKAHFPLHSEKFGRFNMAEFEYKTRGTCASRIVIDVEGGIVNNVRFVGGCMGNTQGVAKLVQGMTVDQVIDRLSGIQCGSKGTSCPDQLAKALISMKES